MIEVVGLNGEMFLINSDLIEKVEFIPETKLILTTGSYYLVREGKKEIIDKIIEFNKKIHKGIVE